MPATGVSRLPILLNLPSLLLRELVFLEMNSMGRNLPYSDVGFHWEGWAATSL